MAEVYRAYHANLDRFVAIKVLHAFLADDPEFKSRFEKEARNIARLRHGNIVQVYDFDYDDESESYYMVMELVEGPTLKERLFRLSEQGKLLPLDSVIRVVREAAMALAYAHSQNMVHRDVKPGNLMLDRDGRVVLTDFGIAKIVTGAQFTSTGGMVGTPAYMAPEQGLGEPGDERADLYSLGVIFFQLVTGRLPYDAETPLAVILKHLNEPVPSAIDYRPDLPPEIDAVITRLMSKDPKTRYQNANELIADLDQLEKTLDLSAAGAPPLAGAGTARLMPTPAVAMTPPSRTPTETAIAPPTNPAATVDALATPRRRSVWTFWGAGVLLVAAAIGLYALAANRGLVPVIGVLPSNTLTATATLTLEPSTDEPTLVAVVPVTEEATDTATPTEEPTATEMPTQTATPSETATESATPTTEATQTKQLATTRAPTSTATPSATASATHTATPSQMPTITRTPPATATGTTPPSNTPRPTRTATATASHTPTPTATSAGSALLDVTQTLVQATRIVENRQATLQACNFNYRIVDQIPADGEFFPTNSVYIRDITLRNTGTCAWERNTSLNFVSGESFSAGPRIFIRETVPVGSEVILRFEGRTPIRGGNLTGKWELRTPELIQIGEPIDISIFAYTR